MTSTIKGLLLVGLLAITPRATAAPLAASVPSACRGVPDAVSTSTANRTGVDHASLDTCAYLDTISPESTT